MRVLGLLVCVALAALFAVDAQPSTPVNANPLNAKPVTAAPGTPAAAAGAAAAGAAASSGSGELKETAAQAMEIHHSLHRPLDQSQVYWNFGGSTVLSKNTIRITPAAQNRRGWLWNDYPIESNNWELEFHLEVYSKPHFGGDGFAMWLLDSSHDPTYHNDPTYLSGDIFGMRRDFKGLGLIFDIYDNDGRRDNPSVFLLYNPEGKETNYNHDNDYKDDMYKIVPEDAPSPFTCTFNLRNLGHPVKVLLRYLQKVLHVYVDNEDGLGYKVCLAVKFDHTFKDYHVAFTALTGQVADAHDILEVNTRYLSEKSDNFSDEFMRYSDDAARCSSIATLYWTVLSFVGIGLVGWVANQLSTFKQLEAEQINPVIVCERINSSIMPQYLTHAGVVAALIAGLQWLPLALNSPLVLWRLWHLYKNSHKLTPAALGGEKVHGTRGVSFTTRLYLTLFSHLACAVIYLYRWYDC